MMKRVHLSNTRKLFDFPDHFIPQDNVRAHMWFNIAASSGKVYAREIRADARKMRGEVEKKMSSAQITMAEQLARECIEKNYKGCY